VVSNKVKNVQEKIKNNIKYLNISQ
jgi:hypothetical protein